MRKIRVLDLDALPDLVGWTVVYVAGLTFSGNDTDSSSTS